MVDTADLKSAARKGVPVRVRFRVPKAAVALAVERILGKDEVTCSNHVSSTRIRSVAQGKSTGLRNQLSGVRISPDRR